MADLRKNAVSEIAVPDAHSLMRAIETLDLMDNGEIIMHAALERKETRGMHLRSDYTFTNPLLSDKFLNVWQENGTVRKNGVSAGTDAYRAINKVMPGQHSLK